MTPKKAVSKHPFHADAEKCAAWVRGTPDLHLSWEKRDESNVHPPPCAATLTTGGGERPTGRELFSQVRPSGRRRGKTIRALVTSRSRSMRVQPLDNAC